MGSKPSWQRLLVSVLWIEMVLGGPTASALTLPELRQRLLERESTMHTLTFTYEQEVSVLSIESSASGKTVPGEQQHSRGKVVIQRPASLWLRQESPSEERMISDGQQVWVYTPKFRQVVVASWTSARRRFPFLTALTGWAEMLSELEARFDLTLHPAERNQYVLRCTPRQADDPIRLRFWLSPEDLFPRRSEAEGEGVRITTQFRNITLNRPVDQKLFRFQVPSGVQVIDESQRGE